MKDRVESRAQDGRFRNASDYVRHPIRKDQERQAAIAAFQRKTTAGVESGAPPRVRRRDGQGPDAGAWWQPVTLPDTV